MEQIEQAVRLYLEREVEAMRTPQGAHHAELIEQVAAETGIPTDVLTEAILDATIAGVN